MVEFSGFYRLSVQERLERLKEHAGLTDDEVAALTDSGSLSMDRADKMVENAIGAIHLPMGIATNFRINGRDMVIPMAVEEPSVIAAACKAAKQSLPEGFTAEADEPIMVGQVQIVDIPDMTLARKNLENSRKEILKVAEEYMKPHAKWGAGVIGFEDRPLMGDTEMLIVEFEINVSDAMGANMVNTTLEGIAPTLEALTEGKVRLRILTNLAVKRKARASAVWSKDVIGEEAIQGVLDGYDLARNDIYRCATHNKGIMNGIDAVMLATGNDWRAVEAGAHSYAAMGRYHPLTAYQRTEKGDLMGTIELPLVAATVGGAVNSSPTAKIALKIMGVKGSKELAMAASCVGLANNFAALSALGTVGIQKGHMKLHARNIAILAGAATPEEIDAVAEKLSQEKDFSSDKARAILEEMRG